MSLDDVLKDFPGITDSYRTIAERLYRDSYIEFYDKNDKVRKDSFRNGDVLMNYERELDRQAKDYSMAVTRNYLTRVSKYSRG